MAGMVRGRTRTRLAGAILAFVLAGFSGRAAFSQTAAQAEGAPPTGPGVPAPDTPEYGLYMLRAADCMPCHTRPGGTPFAGGYRITTPFGSLSSPNITPDPDTGIGGWTDEQFWSALHDGIGGHGEYLYPVMPFDFYTRLTRADVLAMKRYLDTLKPVYAPRAPSAMDFPFDIRATLLVWRELFFRPGTFRPHPDKSAEWNRGAYLVEGAGHCGACHSPRNALGAVEGSDSLAGGDVDQWLAPNISSDLRAGIGGWSVDQIETFLRQGATKREGVAFGPMAEVVHDSLSHLTESDLHDIAVYLKEGPDRPPPQEHPAATAADLRQGAALYLQNCAMCHQDNGRGIPGYIPNLAGNAAVNAPGPHDLIVAVLQGVQGPYGRMPGFAGALSDQDVADIVNHVRTAWRNRAEPDATPGQVAQLRQVARVGAAGTEAARAFDCPKVGSPLIPGTVATSADADLLASGSDADLNNRIDVLIHDALQNDPDISQTELIDALNADVCPAVAGDPALSTQQKRAALARFNARIRAQVQALNIPARDRVLATVPLSPAEMRRIAQAAAAAHETPQQWMARALAGSGGQAGSGPNPPAR